MEFALNALRIGRGSGFGQGAVAFAKRRGITRQGGKGGQQMGIRRSHEQTTEQREKPRSFSRYCIRCRVFLHHGPHQGRSLLMSQLILVAAPATASSRNQPNRIGSPSGEEMSGTQRFVRLSYSS
jgi:hypothetical protein